MDKTLWITVGVLLVCAGVYGAISDEEKAMRAFEAGGANPHVQQGAPLEYVRSLFMEALQQAKASRNLQTMDLDRITALSQYTAFLATGSISSADDAYSDYYYKLLTAPRANMEAVPVVLDQLGSLAAFIIETLASRGMIDDEEMLAEMESVLVERWKKSVINPFFAGFKVPLDNESLVALKVWLEAKILSIPAPEIIMDGGETQQPAPDQTERPLVDRVVESTNKAAQARYNLTIYTRNIDSDVRQAYKNASEFERLLTRSPYPAH